MYNLPISSYEDLKDFNKDTDPNNIYDETGLEKTENKSSDYYEGYLAGLRFAKLNYKLIYGVKE